LNAETHRKYILGGHIADYMRVWFFSTQADVTPANVMAKY
jgi:hypothetical protein